MMKTIMTEPPLDGRVVAGMMMIWSLSQLLWAELYHINNILQCGNILSCNLTSRQLRVRSVSSLLLRLRRGCSLSVAHSWLLLLPVLPPQAVGQCPVVVSGARGQHFSRGWAGLSRTDWRSVHTEAALIRSHRIHDRIFIRLNKNL